jgi:diguanylate cyclase (GGDEF)-like protein
VNSRAEATPVVEHSSTTCLFSGQTCPLTGRLNELERELEQLRALAVTDPLTGLFNPRYLQSSLAREMERTRRTRLPTAIMMLDLDRFKQINDRFGHEAGNATLIWSSNLLRSSLRRIDILCRYGGEEFVVILPATRLDNAVRTAERLRLALSRAPLELGADRVQVTASFGVDAFTADMGLNEHQFLNRVDHYLLQAKRGGRNCIRWRPIEPADAATELTIEERSALSRRE